MKPRKTKLGYKVVVDRRMYGLRLYCQDFPIYRENEWTVPEVDGGPLTVLTSRKAARFLKQNDGGSNLRIFRCLYIPSKHNKVWLEGTLEDSGLTVAELEANNKTLLIPGNTALADAVLIF